MKHLSVFLVTVSFVIATNHLNKAFDDPISLANEISRAKKESQEKIGLVSVAGMASVISVCAGGYFSAALHANGTVFIWGMLGTVFEEPTNVETYFKMEKTEFSKIVCGYYSLYLYSDRGVYCLGRISDNTEYKTPNLSDFIQTTDFLSVGLIHSLVLRNETVYSMGSSVSGQNGRTEDSTTYQKVLTNAKQICAGSEHSVVLLNDRTVMTFGNNRDGALGFTTDGYRPTPKRVKSLTNVTKIACGGDYTIVQVEEKRGEELRVVNYGFGWNGLNQLLDNETKEVRKPTELPHVGTPLPSKYGTTMYIQGNELKCVGDFFRSKTEEYKFANVVQADGGLQHVVMLNTKGQVFTIGRNKFSQLGPAKQEREDKVEL